MTAEERLIELGITLPQTHPPIADYLPVVVVGDIAYVSGHGPQLPDGSFGFTGKVDSEISVEEAKEAARLVILNALASLKATIGSLNRVERVVKLLGMVNSTPGFQRQPEVINGASDLLVELFGEHGRHARSAIGLAALPFGISVEIEMITQLRS